MTTPRFSLRTLALLVTLVCAYFGAWEATKKYGKAPDMPTSGPQIFFGFISDDEVLMPLVIGRSEDGTIVGRDEQGDWTVEITSISCYRYYLWLFGPTIKLPFERKPDYTP